jgi:hypothetical protein
MQGNRPRACRLGVIDAGAEQKRRTGDATKSDGLAGGYAGVPTVFLQHTRVCSGGLAREQENPEVRGEVGIANQSDSIVLSHGPRHPTVLTPRGLLNRYHHESPRRLLLRPSSTHGNPSQQTSSSPMESHHRRALLTANPVHHGKSLSTRSSPQPKLPQGLP